MNQTIIVIIAIYRTPPKNVLSLLPMINQHRDKESI